MITITESAQDYLAELLEKQDDTLGVRVFINQPGTPRAETCIAYCRDGDIQEDDVEEKLAKFTVWYESRSVPFLEDALVDYSKDRMGGQLTITRAKDGPLLLKGHVTVFAATGRPAWSGSKAAAYWSRACFASRSASSG